MEKNEIIRVKSYSSREEALAAAMKLIDEMEAEKTPLGILLSPLDAFNRFLEKCRDALLGVKKIRR